MPDQHPTSDDPTRLDNPFDAADGYSGQDYHRDREAELARRDPSGGVPSTLSEGDAPTEAGRRPHVDPATGEVHGSGSGAGGGNAGEDYDSDEHGGSGYPVTGADEESAVIDKSSD